MPETRHADWTSEWEAIRANDYDRGRKVRRRLVYWNRVVRGADSRGRTERLTVSRARDGQAGPWVWWHYGPEPRSKIDSRAKVNAMSGGYGTTTAAKRAADRYFAQLLAAERLADRYFELIELAGCSPDSPNIAYPGDHDGAAAWLAQRVIAEHGDETTVDECRQAADAYWARLHQAPSHDLGRMRL
jgi:hypothetical protein